MARVVGDDGCHPVRYNIEVTACTVSLQAVASDPDGDPLHFQWSGCASGTASSATCPIDGLGSFTALVEVTDGRGGRVKAEKTVAGTNAPPVVRPFGCFYLPGQNRHAPDCGLWACPPPLPTNGIGSCIEGSFYGKDAEGDSEGCGPVTTSGACTGVPVIFECGGAAGAFSFEFRTGSGAGDCVLRISVHDGWGATASTVVSLPVRPLP